MQRIFHTPEGVRDIYGIECAQKKQLEQKIHNVFEKYGFMDIETPTFEYFEVFSKEVGTTPSRELYKFFDREGNTLVLRPDFTPSVSRACATYFDVEDAPVRLCYTGNTFINNSEYRGRLKQSTQMGIELFGDPSSLADAEVIALTVEALLAAGLKEFQVSIGQVDYFKCLLQDVNLSEEEEEKLRSIISSKNYFAVEDFLKEKEISKEIANAFIQLPQMFGGVEMLEKAKLLTSNRDAIVSVERLEEIYDLLCVYGYEKYVSFDFGMLSKYHYYTGIIFQAYTYGTGDAVLKGGRYNNLMKHFGTPAEAVGFAIIVDQLQTAIHRQKVEVASNEMPISISYTKETYKEAIEEATRLRKEGKKVALCPLKG
ncbi:MAG: ATP phosphoribosyltransferase regulatory subunit [Eubacteriales bacterium]|nr:ATP phosphoribosyltransferase regulatory subunit [Eubacteriales bacterium]